jgi:GNAT superfamily N-acetyltransferase
MVPITRTELATRYPGLEPEIDHVVSWFDVPLRYHLRRDPAENHFPPVMDAFNAYTEHKDSVLRVRSCMTMAVKMPNVVNSGPWPIFLYAEDGFLLEGWHRLVAFRMMGLDEVDVVLVERDAPNVSPDRFSHDEVRVEDHAEWCFSARWRGHQIGHLRINQEDHMPGDGRHVDNAFVLPAFRRRGVASLLYNAAERFLTGRGLRLVPSPSPSLSKSAAALWASRRPAA